MLLALASGLMAACVGVAGCSSAPADSAPTASVQPFPAASGLLTDANSRIVMERAAGALAEQRTTAVNFVAERADGQPLRQILNPTLRLDLRDPDRPVASLALSILASNVAVGGNVYRQQATPDGASTVWVRDPEPRTPLEFVLWRPGAASVRVAAWGGEQVAGRAARRYRVFDPAGYSGPTTLPTGTTPPTGTATATPGLTSPTTGAMPSTSASSPTGGQSSSGTGIGKGVDAGVGDYDDFWFAEDGTLLRMVSVNGQLRLTSIRIEYGGDVRIDVPDTEKAISAQEYDRRVATASPSPTPS